MSNERGLATIDAAPAIDTEVLHKLVVEGDLSKLDGEQQVNYYRTMCEATGLDYRTRPFAFIRLNGKLVLYALREATEQLRHRQNVSVEIVDRQLMGEVYVVTARAMLPNGRTDASTGAVAIASLKGEALANAYMKAETKAKRRVTLSICGLGLMDESEAIDVPGAEFVGMQESGAVKPAALPQRPLANHDEHLSEEQAKRLQKFVRERGYSGDDMRWWMAHIDKARWSELTEAEGKRMAQDAEDGRRPWQEPVADGPIGDLIGDDFDAESEAS